MKIQVGDMFRIKATGEILEITGDWFNSEYRYNSYSPDGIPCCGANGHHNISGNIERWYKSGGLEKIKPLPSEPYMIFRIYEHKRLITDKIEVIEENINDKPAKKVEKCDGTITMAKPTYSDINNKTIFLIQAKKLNDNNLIPAQDYGYEVINAIEYDEWYNRKTRYGYTLYDGFDMDGSGHRFLQEYLNTQYIPVGSVEYVEEYIRQCYRIQSVIPLNVPLQLYKYVNRFATIIGNEEFENKLNPDRKYFIKSATKIKGYSDFIIPKKAKDIPHDTYFVSEIIDIETEWRCFVKDGELLDIRCYSGNPFVMPDIYTIKKMIKEYTDCPPAYTLDVCKTSDGITSIVECHNFFSCGLYGFSDYKNYLIMLIRAFRWQVTKGKK